MSTVLAVADFTRATVKTYSGAGTNTKQYSSSDAVYLRILELLDKDGFFVQPWTSTQVILTKNEPSGGTMHVTKSAYAQGGTDGRS